MKLEELIAALNESNIDMKAQEEIIVKLNRYEDSQELEYFTVLETCKGDMTHQFEDSPKVIAKIDQLTDEQIEEVAADVGNQLIEYYREALVLAVEAELEEDK
jgi:hypothetical protein